LKYSQLTAYLSTKDKIIITSLDRNNHSDTDAQVYIDRFLINKLLKSGYNVLERDNHILLAATAEGAKNSDQLISLYNGSATDSLFNKTYIPIYYGSKILAYRLLELGTLKMKIPNSNETKRVGNAEIEFRIIDASTTQILASELITGYYEDTILDDELSFITNLHYKFDTDAYPLLKQIDGKNQIDNLSKTVEDKTITRYTVINLNFKRGTKSDAVIKFARTGSVIKSFVIPEESGIQKGYTYEWNVEKLPVGKYDIYINGKYESSIDL